MGPQDERRGWPEASVVIKTSGRSRREEEPSGRMRGGDRLVTQRTPGGVRLAHGEVGGALGFS